MTRSRSVALLGEQALPRVDVAPPPTRANAWEDVADLSRRFGVTLDEWQEAVLRSAMGERTDGTWAAKQVGVSAPRQNGKSQLIVARALAGALLFGEKKIVISAHAQDTARETFAKFLEIRDVCPALDERIDKVMSALNREFIRFKNGAVIQFKARTVSGSRGFSSDCLLLDEAQILGMPAWVSINSTMSARPNPQVWLLGTPPTPEDNGEVFTSIRKAALGGKSRTLAWLEWGADPEDDPALDATRAKANPAWHTRINHEIVQGEYETYPPERFALDRLGRWISEDLIAAAIPEWPGLVGPPPSSPEGGALGVACDVEETRAVLAWCSDPESPFVAINDARPWTARESFAEHVADVQQRLRCPVVVRAKSTLIPALEAAGVELTLAARDDRIQAASDLAAACQRLDLRHGDYPELNAAVTAAKWRTLDGRRVLVDLVGDLEAATLAMWGATTATNYDVLDSIF